MKHRLSLLPLLALVFALPASAADAPAPAYPLDTCLVSGEALDSMGSPYVFTHKEEGKPDREVRLCCKSCLKKFTKDPVKYLAKLDAAKAGSAAPAAPAKTDAPAADAHAGHNH